MVVTLRHERRELGVGTSGPGPATLTAVRATVAAVQDARKKGRELPPDSSELLIEMEAIGEERPVGEGDDWFRPGAAERLLEPGVDGFTIRGPASAKRVCPSEIVIKNQALSEAVKTVVEHLNQPVGVLRLYRFRTRHWYQAASAEDVVQLRRGLVLLSHDDLSRPSITESIDQIGALLGYRLKPSGKFAYEYEPAVEGYTRRDNAVHQAGATWALATYTASSSLPAARAAAESALQAHLARVKDLEGVTGASYVESEDRKNRLSLTAQVALAIRSHRSRERHADILARLRAGMIWLQRPEGDFIPAFPPARRLPESERHPAQALLALLDERSTHADRRMERVFERALEHHRDHFSQEPTMESAAWLVQPFARRALASGEQEMARFAFELGDWLIERQLTPSNCPWPELHGGVVPDPEMTPDISTAVVLSGWLDCLSLARRMGDAERTRAYELGAQRAARFVLQLQMRESEAYYVRVVRDVVGGVRTSPADNRMPLENLQYALLALNKYRNLMFWGNP